MGCWGDVAHLDGEGTVLKITHMRRNRIGVPVWKATTVVEAEAGAFERWGLKVGDQVELREGPPPVGWCW